MLYKNRNLCDFCFNEIEDGKTCSHCGISLDTYNMDAGLLMPGTNILGRYIIGRVLGRGGFGATYLAFSSKFERAVAIKEYLPLGIAYRAKGEEKINIISSEKGNLFERGAKAFFEEAKTISKFAANENIVSVHEFFYANDTVYYSMEYLDGCDLKKYVDKKGGRLGEKEVIKIARSVCNALDTVHGAATLHRDITPDNIFMCDDGSVMLIDFGAAKEIVSDVDKSYSVVVKQGFAPLEQYTRRGNQGPWTDIYALGATMYYAISGKIPPDAIDRVNNGKLEFPEGVSEDFKKVILKCMENDTDKRYRNIAELRTELDNISKVSIEVQKLNLKKFESIEKLFGSNYRPVAAPMAPLEPINKGEIQRQEEKNDAKDNMAGKIIAVVVCVIVLLWCAFSCSSGTGRSSGVEEKIDTSGFAYRFDSIGEYKGGIAIVQNDGKYGFINTDGKIVVPIIYDSVMEFSEGLARVKKGQLYGFVNKNGRVVIPVKYTSASSFSKGISDVNENGRRFKIDKNGNIVE